MMDCEFTYNYQDKSHGVVTCSEHIAIGICLSHEFGQQSEHRLSDIEALLVTLESEHDKRIELNDWVVEIEDEEVCFKHNSLCSTDPDIDEPDVDSYLDWELIAKCGKDDLLDLLSSWLSFVIEQKG